MSDVATLRKKGIIVLSQVFNDELLNKLLQTAQQCFQNIEKLGKEKGFAQLKEHLPARYNFLPYVTSLNVCALADYDSEIVGQVLSLIEQSPIREVILQAMGNGFSIDLTQSWLRKQYAPAHYHELHHPHSWHQDGSLGLDFPLTSDQPYLDMPFNPLISCWIPLTDCGITSPGLQFVTQPLEKPLHFHYLQEGTLKEMFAEQDFYAPELTAGDAVIFLPGTLHKTHVTPAMTNDRLSIEFRFFRQPQALTHSE